MAYSSDCIKRFISFRLRAERAGKSASVLRTFATESEEELEEFNNDDDDHWYDDDDVDYDEYDEFYDDEK